MKTVMKMAFACALGLAMPGVPCSASESTAPEKSTYVVTDKMAMYLSSDNRLRLRFGSQKATALVEVLNGPRTLYQNHIDLRKGANQNLNLSELETGRYLIRVTIGKQVTTKSLVVSRQTEQSFRLS